MVCIYDKSCYGYAMKRCIQDDKLESEIAAWNKRAQMTPEQDIEKEEPAPVECKQRRRSLLLIGVRLLLGHNGWTPTSRCQK